MLVEGERGKEMGEGEERKREERQTETDTVHRQEL